MREAAFLYNFRPFKKKKKAKIQLLNLSALVPLYSSFPYTMKWAIGFFEAWMQRLQYWILYLLKLTQYNKAYRAKSNDHIQISIWERVCAKEDVWLLMFK